MTAWTVPDGVDVKAAVNRSDVDWPHTAKADLCASAEGAELVAEAAPDVVLHAA